MRTRAERRKSNFKHIRKHKKLLTDIGALKEDFIQDIRCRKDMSNKDNMFSNHDIVNKYTHFGKSAKTKPKNSHASYRHKGGYGKAITYSRHDQKQVDKMNSDIGELYESGYNFLYGRL